MVTLFSPGEVDVLGKYGLGSSVLGKNRGLGSPRKMTLPKPGASSPIGLWDGGGAFG